MILARIDYEAMALNVVPMLRAYVSAEPPWSMDGVLVFHDSWGVTTLTVALGLVEFVSEVLDEVVILRITIIIAAIVAIGCLCAPLLVWRFYYQQTDGSTYNEVI